MPTTLGRRWRSRRDWPGRPQRRCRPGFARALGMRSTAVTRDPVGSPATIGKVCRPTPAPRSYAWTGCVTPAPVRSKAGASVERLVAADGPSPGPHELIYRHSSVTGKAHPSLRTGPVRHPEQHWSGGCASRVVGGGTDRWFSGSVGWQAPNPAPTRGSPMLWTALATAPTVLGRFEMKALKHDRTITRKSPGVLRWSAGCPELMRRWGALRPCSRYRILPHMHPHDREPLQRAGAGHLPAKGGRSAW